MIPVPLSALLAGVLVVILAIGGASWKAYDAGEAHQASLDGAALQKQKDEAARTLLAETNRANAAERKMASNVHDAEVKSELDSHAIDDLAGKLRVASGSNNRLRDPNARPGSCGSGPQGAYPVATGNRQLDGTETPGLLSTELTGLLQRVTREADDINNAYTACRGERLTLTTPADGTNR